MLDLQNHPAKLAHVNCRSENNGKDLVPAADLKFEFDESNRILDQFQPGLRESLFVAEEARQGKLIDSDILTKLRVSSIGTVPLDLKFPGYTIKVATPFGSLDIEEGRATVDNFRVTPKEGGSVSIVVRVRLKNPSAETIGLLGVRVGHALDICLTPPTSEQLEAMAAAEREPVQTQIDDGSDDGDGSDEAQGNAQDAGVVGEALEAAKDTQVTDVVDALLQIDRYAVLMDRLRDPVDEWDDIDREDVLAWAKATIAWQADQNVNIPTKPSRMADIDEMLAALNLPAAPAKRQTGSRRRDVN
jgi:hypothetical protein